MQQREEQNAYQTICRNRDDGGRVFLLVILVGYRESRERLLLPSQEIMYEMLYV
jgi:hypothetical protein